MGCSQMFPFNKAQIISPPLPSVTISALHEQLTTSPDVSWNKPAPPSACQTNHARQSSVKSVSPFSENYNQIIPRNPRTQTYTHIYTYTQTKYMASNVESRQLNKWHFLLCFFFSWYRHNHTLCSSSTLVWVDTMNIISFHPFFVKYLHIDVRSTSGLKHYFHYYFKQYEEQCVLLLRQLIRKNHTQNTFWTLKMSLSFDLKSLIFIFKSSSC